MHGDVVTGGVGLPEPGIDQVGSVEPADKTVVSTSTLQTEAVL